MNSSERLIITSKDVMIITGLCLRSSQRLLQKIRSLNPSAHQFVSVEEFCKYMRLDEEKVMRNFNR